VSVHERECAREIFIYVYLYIYICHIYTEICVNLCRVEYGACAVGATCSSSCRRRHSTRMMHIQHALCTFNTHYAHSQAICTDTRKMKQTRAPFHITLLSVVFAPCAYLLQLV